LILLEVLVGNFFALEIGNIVQYNIA